MWWAGREVDCTQFSAVDDTAAKYTSIRRTHQRSTGAGRCQLHADYRGGVVEKWPVFHSMPFMTLLRGIPVFDVLIEAAKDLLARVLFSGRFLRDSSILPQNRP
jgi:hypothetical protein